MTRYAKWRKRAEMIRNEAARGNIEPADVLDPVARPSRWRLMRVTDDATMVGRERRRRLLSMIRTLNSEGVPGDVAELGVFKGGTAGVLGLGCADATPPRHLWLFDSFQGLPEPLPQDGELAAEYAKGRTGGATDPIDACVGPRDEVEAFLFGRAGLKRSDVTLVEGWYQDTLPDTELPELALLHVDCDWYESVRLALDSLYDRVVPGGYVVLDDYGEWQGASLALHEFLGSRGIATAIERGGHTQAFFRKE